MAAIEQVNCYSTSRSGHWQGWRAVILMSNTISSFDQAVQSIGLSGDVLIKNVPPLKKSISIVYNFRFCTYSERCAALTFGKEKRWVILLLDTAICTCTNCYNSFRPFKGTFGWASIHSWCMPMEIDYWQCQFDIQTFQSDTTDNYKIDSLCFKRGDINVQMSLPCKMTFN